MKTAKLFLLAFVFAACGKTDANSSGGGGVILTLSLPPSNLGATATSSTNVNLTWTDNSNNEDGFRIERKMLSNSYVLIANV